jgi:hypothetical protein
MPRIRESLQQTLGSNKLSDAERKDQLRRFRLNSHSQLHSPDGIKTLGHISSLRMPRINKLGLPLLTKESSTASSYFASFA